MEKFVCKGEVSGLPRRGKRGDIVNAGKKGFSGKGFKEGELYAPSYISISADGLIYVVDGGRVQVLREVE